jgi:hypothetical protein
MFVDQEDHIWVLNRPRDLDASNNYATLIRQPPNAASRHRPFWNST